MTDITEVLAVVRSAINRLPRHESGDGPYIFVRDIDELFAPVDRRRTFPCGYPHCDCPGGQVCAP